MDRLSITDEIVFRADGPYTKKLYQTERTILMIVCLEPGQVIPSHSHVSREAFVYGLQGTVRFTPGEGEGELEAGGMLPDRPPELGGDLRVALEQVFPRHALRAGRPAGGNDVGRTGQRLLHVGGPGDARPGKGSAAR